MFQPLHIQQSSDGYASGDADKVVSDRLFARFLGAHRLDLLVMAARQRKRRLTV
jgi:hypothetical protein